MAAPRRTTTYDGEAITLIQGKTRRQVWIPCTNALRAALDGAPRRTATILTKPGGMPWTKDAFYQAWKAAFDAAAFEADLHFHDLRGTAVTMLSEAGCTPQEVATITAHTIASVNKTLQVYLARSAIIKLNTHRRNAG